MKRLIIGCLLALFANALSFAQPTFKEAKINQKTATSLMANNEANKITQYFKATGYKAGGFITEGTTSYSGKDSIGDFTITMATQQLIKKGAQTIDLTTVKMTRGKTTETLVIAQDDQNIYKVVNTEVKATKQDPSITKSWDYCIQKYGSGMYQSCSSCFSCLKSCISNNKKFWKKVGCCLGCGGCGSCFKNIVGFVTCLAS